MCPIIPCEYSSWKQIDSSIFITSHRHYRQLFREIFNRDVEIQLQGIQFSLKVEGLLVFRNRKRATNNRPFAMFRRAT